MRVRYLRQTELERLRELVAENLERYRSGDFSELLTDHSKYFEGTFEVNEGEFRNFAQTNSDVDEVENCVKCFSAMKDLTSYEARDERIWTYLTHTYLLVYARERWPIPDAREEAVTHIKTHFFAKDKRGLERDNAASRLWWMAKLCHRVPDLDLRESLRVLLFRSDVRANIIERPTASQSVEVFSAIIKALHASYHADRILFERKIFRPLMVRINSIGGVRLLDCMSETQLSTLIGGIVQRELGVAAP